MLRLLLKRYTSSTQTARNTMVEASIDCAYFLVKTNNPSLAQNIFTSYGAKLTDTKWMFKKTGLIQAHAPVTTTTTTTTAAAAAVNSGGIIIPTSIPLNTLLKRAVEYGALEVFQVDIPTEREGMCIRGIQASIEVEYLKLLLNDFKSISIGGYKPVVSGRVVYVPDMNKYGDDAWVEYDERMERIVGELRAVSGEVYHNVRGIDPWY